MLRGIQETVRATPEQSESALDPVGSFSRISISITEFC